MPLLSCNAESAISICDGYDSHKVRKFRYEELALATDGFSTHNLLGKGSHGSIYKAVLRRGKLTAAVKRNNSSGNTAAENEIEILSRIRNPGLVNMIGFCIDCKNDEGRLLVLEYMPNGSLCQLLHSGSASRLPGWKTRLRHALEIARAVHALHSLDPPVIHRDIKSSNVLIDRKGYSRLGDFGLALRGYVEDVRVSTTPPAGTLGYLDPSYLAPADLSTKSDVFSFGILLLELISGRHAIDLQHSPPSLVDWAVPAIKRGTFDEICDPRIDAPSDISFIQMMAVLAARCVRSKADKRPNMAEAVECLKVATKRAQGPRVCGVLGRSCVRRVHLTDQKRLRNVKRGSRGQNVTTVGEYGRAMERRSKSVGGIGKRRVGPDTNEEDGPDVALIRHTRAVVTRLRKCRSTGVIRNTTDREYEGKLLVHT